MSRMTSSEMSKRVRDKKLADLFRTNEDFRRFVWTILQAARILHPTFAQGSPDGTSYHEGRRSLGLEIIHMLTAVEPNAFAIMATEGLSLSVGVPTPERDDANPSDLPPDFDRLP